MQLPTVCGSSSGQSNIHSNATVQCHLNDLYALQVSRRFEFFSTILQGGVNVT